MPVLLEVAGSKLKLNKIEHIGAQHSPLRVFPLDMHTNQVTRVLCSQVQIRTLTYRRAGSVHI